MGLPQQGIQPTASPQQGRLPGASSQILLRPMASQDEGHQLIGSFDQRRRARARWSAHDRHDRCDRRADRRVRRVEQ
eukprot:scaffold2608_cov272-Pavlova_lutheri.AAC.1